MPLFHRIYSKNAHELNTALVEGFLEHQNDEGIRKTHLFEGRYENIYLNHLQIPELSTVIAEAIALAEKVTNTTGLRVGYWFNYMPPGATTTLHTHDDDDEVLSSAYYVYVPEGSGDIILHGKKETVQLQPREGEFIMFKPDAPHEVTKNNSKEHRLSIGMNFGIDR